MGTEDTTFFLHYISVTGLESMINTYIVTLLHDSGTIKTKMRDTIQAHRAAPSMYHDFLAGCAGSLMTFRCVHDLWMQCPVSGLYLDKLVPRLFQLL